MNSGAGSCWLTVDKAKGTGSRTGNVGNGEGSWQARGTKGEAGLLAGGANGEAYWTADRAVDEAVRLWAVSWLFRCCLASRAVWWLAGRLTK